ncbi:MAG: FtsX-like permease family protein [Candidatus Brocadiia bacterium]
MPESAPTGKRPLLDAAPLFIGLRYLLKKKLSYLAILGVALSVGVIIVVMSVFTGFHQEFTAAIRGYLSDLSVRPLTGGIYGMDDWRLWRRAVLEANDHVEGAAPFIEGAGLLRNAATGEMVHVMFRGVHPELEGTVSRLPEYMQVGSLEDLKRTYPNPEGGRLKACFVGAEFFRDVPADLTENPRELVLVSATPDLRRAFGKYAVNGIFKTGNAEYDSKFVIIGLETAAQLVDTGGAVSGLNLRLDDYKHADEVKADLSRELGPGTVLSRARAAGATATALSGDGERFAVLTADGRLVVSDVQTDETLLSRSFTGSQPAAVALSPDGSRALVGLADGGVLVVGVDDGAETFRREEGAAVTAAAFGPFGYYFAVGREDGSVETYDAETDELLGTGRDHEGRVNDVAFDADGELLISASDDGSARLWDVETAGGTGVLRDGAGQSVTSAAFSPDGQVLLTGRADGMLTLWRASTGESVLDWQGQDGPVLAARFGWTSMVVLSAGPEGISAWNLARRQGRSLAWQQFEVPAGGDAISAAAIGQDGTHVATVSADGAVRLRYSGPGHYVTTWEEERKTFLEAVEMERFLQGLIMSLILVLAEFFIFAIITTMVYEKRRDIGILKAVGFTSGQVCLVFLVCGLAIGTIGALLGVGGGVLFADNINAVRDFIREAIGWDPFPANVYYFTEIPAYVGLITPALTAGGAIVCSLIFSIIPALRAARMDPVRTLHYE